MILLLVFGSLLAFCALIFLAACFHKIRQIHLSAFKLLEDTASIRREVEALFSQVQALLALERRLAMPDALPPMRGWAGSPDFLLQVANEVLRKKPRVIMECSSGVSTIVIARCLQMNGNGHVFSLENDIEYADKTRAMLVERGLADFATVVDAPLRQKDGGAPWYDTDAIAEDMPPVDLLVVDGPPATVAPLARYPALPRLLNRLSSRCTIMLDDASRSDEVEMLRLWSEEFPQFRQTILPCEKGLVVLRRQAD